MDSASICLPRVHWLFLVDYKTSISVNLDKHFLFSFGSFEDEKMERGPWDTQGWQYGYMELSYIAKVLPDGLAMWIFRSKLSRW